MKRRKAIQSILYLSLAGSGLMACNHERDAWLKLELQKLHLNNHQKNLTKDLAMAILPVHTLKGWSQIDLFPVAMGLIDHSYGKNDITKFINGLDAIDKYARLQHHMPFLSCNENQKSIMLKKWNAASNTSEDTAAFTVAVLKKEMLSAFTSCEEFLRKYRMYEMAPARYKSCLPIDQIKTLSR